MRFAFVCPRLDLRGGAENLAIWSINELIDRGHTVEVITKKYNKSLWPEDLVRQITFKTLPTPGFRDKWRTRTGRLKHIGRQIAQMVGQHAILVAHNYPANIWIHFAKPFLVHCRTVMYCHEPPVRLYWDQVMPHVIKAYEDSGRTSFKDFVSGMEKRGEKRGKKRLGHDRKLDQSSVQGLDLVLANSQFTADAVERIYQRPSVVCYPGVTSPKPKQQRSSSPFIAWISSTAPHKNAKLFLAGVKAVLENDPERAKELRVRASGINNAPFKSLIGSLGLENTVHLESWLTDDQLADMISDAAFVAYPNLDEPFGLVPIEAMARSKAVLTANIGGPSETNIHNSTGLCVDVTSIAELAQGIASLWGDPQRCIEMGKAGQARYSQQFTMSAFTDRFLEAIEHQLSNGKQS
jgi:glycosyltransferase involved in cell wall biosynthesis